MANIEMYGFKKNEAIGVEAMICQLFEDKPYRDDYVTTIIRSVVVDHHNVKQPFLRLVTTKDKYMNDIIKELQKLKFDIEVMVLDRFIPKK